MMFFLDSVLEDAVSDAIESVRIFNWDALRQYFQDSAPTVLNFLMKLIIAVVIILVGRWLIRVVRRMLDRFLVRTGIDEGVRRFFDRLVNVLLWILLILFVLSQFGVTASSVIAIVGSIGLSIGLALQGALSNFAGGVLILVIRPFKVGDYIQDNNGNEGVVSEIKLFYTELTAIDNRILVIPNGELSNESLTNYTRMEKRRLDLTVGISYHADLALAKRVLTETALREEKRLPDEQIDVFVRELGEDSVKMGIRVWVATEDYWDVKWRLTENIKYALDENGIVIPFRQVTVSYDKPENENIL